MENSTAVPDVTQGSTLWAGVERALLMLFIEGDRLSSLELAPIDDDRFSEFPPVVDIDFSAQFSDG